MKSYFTKLSSQTGNRTPAAADDSTVFPPFWGGWGDGKYSSSRLVKKNISYTKKKKIRQAQIWLNIKNISLKFMPFIVRRNWLKNYVCGLLTYGLRR